MSIQPVEIIQGVLILISIGTTIWVKIILKKQIKSQNAIIESYKGLVDATNPDKIIALHEKEIAQIKRMADGDIELLKTQVIELGRVVTHQIEEFERWARNIGQPELFNRITYINNNMPHCSRVINVILELNQQSAASHNAK